MGRGFWLAHPFFSLRQENFLGSKVTRFKELFVTAVRWPKFDKKFRVAMSMQLGQIITVSKNVTPLGWHVHFWAEAQSLHFKHITLTIQLG
jgi:hypothetical protein